MRRKYFSSITKKIIKKKGFKEFDIIQGVYKLVSPCNVISFHQKTTAGWYLITQTLPQFYLLKQTYFKLVSC